MVALTFPDGVRRDYPDGVTGLEVAKAISPSLAKRTVAMALDGTLADLADRIDRDARIEFVNRDDPRALELIRHDAAHVLAEAVQTLWPGTQVTIGPVIENGFYYDFFRNEPFTPEDFPAIEKKMREIVARDRPFTKEVWSRDEARRVFRDKGEMFKVELVDAIPADQNINIYKQGDWFDLCRGPHMTSTAKVGNAFKLMKVAGAYWRGDSKNPMLTRIYGTAWNKQEELDAYLKQIEEAEKRDHRRLGREMDLFHFQEEAPGSVFWHAKGWTLFQALENYIRRRQAAAGYAEVNAPQLMDSSLWVASGHMATFRENMFLTQPREDDERVFVVKPMNCPGHIQIFKHGLKSYRDLPYKLGEFGKVHRFEPSGALHGLMRVRAFTQDDAHVFITEEQIAAEALAMNDLILSIYRDFGFSDVAIKFSDRPDKRIGDDAVWDKAEAALMATLKASGRPWTLNKGEGAFYGPKLEYVLRDAIGRDWQCGTIQVDLNMPGRLGAFYIDEHSNKVTPVMLHRAMFGSLERFTGILIEHYAGHFPLWLAPTQLVIATIVSDADFYAREVADLARRAGLRVETDLRNEKINYKVREHSLAKVPALLVVGKKEAETRTVSIRRLGAQEQTVVALDQALAELAAEAVAPDVRRESQYGSQVLFGAQDQKMVPLDKALAKPAAEAAPPDVRRESEYELQVLFEDHERTRTEALHRGETRFEFYDSCASPGYEELRSVVNGWLAQMPASDRAELIARMRYGGDREFRASLSELALHAFIVGSGYRASPHPKVPGSAKRPDYAAIDQAGALVAYIEVTTVNPPDAQEAEENRENPVFNAINNAKIPAGSILGYKLVRAGKSSPALRALVADVEHWARESAEVAKTKEVSKTFTAGDWIVELDLYSGGSNPEPPTQAIGTAQLRGGVIAPHKNLRDALYEKTRKYGALDKPYLIAVADGKDQLFSKRSVHSALTEAVFGDGIVQFKGDIYEVTHAKNGFWHGPKGARNQHVSGVLLLPETDLWKLREEKWQPVLAVNPWAERPLPDALRTMSRFEADNDHWVFREGKRFADIIELPDPWPPVEAG